jgi:hypothetical protein
MVWGMRAAVTSAVLLALTAAGCAASKSSQDSVAPEASRSALAGPLTGVRLSALIPTPAGFTLDASTSSNSGSRVATLIPGPSASAVGCASWWAGHGYFGPGTVGYAVKNYTGSDQVELHLEVNLYPSGAGPQVFDASVAIQRRCRHFSYLDTDGLRYVVNATVGPSAGIGDHSQEIDATETSPTGTVWRTQTTFVQVGDGFVIATETGPVGAPLDRAALPLARIASSLRSAG